MKIKTRFAPSPTGYLHVGGARTALYSWLFARNHGGEFVLRIEDTDLERSTPEAIEAIMDGMNWLNLQWDEGPYFQTKRFDRYNNVIDEMLEAGTAYKCYCSKERLEALEIQKDELTAKIADEKLKKPSFNEDFIRFWLLKFRKFDISQKKQRKALIEIFVNAIFLYDDRILITFNYKDGTQTVRFEDTLTADSAEEKSSDLSSLAGP